MGALQDLLTEHRQQIKDLKADLKEVKKSKNPERIAGLEQTIKEEENFVLRFRTSVMDPARANNSNIIINRKLYNQFMKKLKGLQRNTELRDDGLYITYSNGPMAGSLVLYDLSEHFPADATFPGFELDG